MLPSLSLDLLLCVAPLRPALGGLFGADPATLGERAIDDELDAANRDELVTGRGDGRRRGGGRAVDCFVDGARVTEGRTAGGMTI
jgi:hypothetical protein